MSPPSGWIVPGFSVWMGMRTGKTHAAIARLANAHAARGQIGICFPYDATCCRLQKTTFPRECRSSLDDCSWKMLLRQPDSNSWRGLYHSVAVGANRHSIHRSGNSALTVQAVTEVVVVLALARGRVLSDMPKCGILLLVYWCVLSETACSEERTYGGHCR